MNHRFDGIVLFKRSHRENDGLVKIFTKEYGKVMFFIRGLEKANHPHKSQLLPLTLNEYIGTINQQGLSFISEARTLNFHRHIQEDVYKQAYSIYLSQLLDAAVDDRKVDLRLFESFKDVIEMMNSQAYPALLTLYFEIYLLKYFGYNINFNNCVICHSQQQPFDFSMTKQGVLCQKHWNEDNFRLHANPRALYFLDVLSRIQVQQINKVNISQQTLKDLRTLMDEIYKEFVGIKLRSKSYLNQLLTFENSLNPSESQEEL